MNNYIAKFQIEDYDENDSPSGGKIIFETLEGIKITELSINYRNNNDIFFGNSKEQFGELLKAMLKNTNFEILRDYGNGGAFIFLKNNIITFRICHFCDNLDSSFIVNQSLIDVFNQIVDCF